MITVKVGNEWLDINYKLPMKGHHQCFLGHICIGSISKIRTGWICASNYPNSIGVVSGFKTRADAAIFLLTMRRTFDADYVDPFANDKIGECSQSPDGEHASTASTTNGPFMCRRCGKPMPVSKSI